MSNMSSCMKTFMDPKKNPLARMHKKAIEHRLRPIGLRYEDMFYTHGCNDLKEALNRLPKDVLQARDQRLKRAMDLNMKHEHLSDDLQALQTPWRTYLWDIVTLVVKEMDERKALGAVIPHKFYHPGKPSF